jgi:hypothetical protein
VAVDDFDNDDQIEHVIASCSARTLTFEVISERTRRA